VRIWIGFAPLAISQDFRNDIPHFQRAANSWAAERGRLRPTPRFMVAFTRKREIGANSGISIGTKLRKCSYHQSTAGNLLHFFGGEFSVLLFDFLLFDVVFLDADFNLLCFWVGHLLPPWESNTLSVFHNHIWVKFNAQLTR